MVNCVAMRLPHTQLQSTSRRPSSPGAVCTPDQRLPGGMHANTTGKSVNSFKKAIFHLLPCFSVHFFAPFYCWLLSAQLASPWRVRLLPNRRFLLA